MSCFIIFGICLKNKHGFKDVFLNKCLLINIIYFLHYLFIFYKQHFYFLPSSVSATLNL